MKALTTLSISPADRSREEPISQRHKFASGLATLTKVTSAPLAAPTSSLCSLQKEASTPPFSFPESFRPGRSLLYKEEGDRGFFRRTVLALKSQTVPGRPLGLQTVGQTQASDSWWTRLPQTEKKSLRQEKGYLLTCGHNHAYLTPCPSPSRHESLLLLLSEATASWVGAIRLLQLSSKT